MSAEQHLSRAHKTALGAHTRHLTMNLFVMRNQAPVRQNMLRIKTKKRGISPRIAEANPSKSLETYIFRTRDLDEQNRKNSYLFFLEVRSSERTARFPFLFPNA